MYARRRSLAAQLPPTTVQQILSCRSMAPAHHISDTDITGSREVADSRPVRGTSARFRIDLDSSATGTGLGGMEPLLSLKHASASTHAAPAADASPLPCPNPPPPHPSPTPHPPPKLCSLSEHALGRHAPSRNTCAFPEPFKHPSSLMAGAVHCTVHRAAKFSRAE